MTAPRVWTLALLIQLLLSTEALLSMSVTEELQLRLLIREEVGAAIHNNICQQDPPPQKRQTSEASLQGGTGLLMVADEVATQVRGAREELESEFTKMKEQMQADVTAAIGAARASASVGGQCSCAPHLNRLELGIQEQFENLLKSVVDVAEIAIGTQQALRQQLGNVSQEVSDLSTRLSAVGPAASRPVDPDMRLALLSDSFYRYVNVSRHQLQRVLAIQERSSAMLQLVADKSLAPPRPPPPCGGPARDCADLRRQGFTTNGVYLVRPELGDAKLASVFCDMTTAGGGWTVVQRRADVPQHVNFFRSWAEYRVGFGNRSGEFWGGNELLYQLTSDRTMTLRLDMADLEGNTRYAEYTGFSVGSESQQYRLRIGPYSGNAGDGIGRANGVGFTTHDRDNDQYASGNCAQLYKGGWWYDACHNGNPNGLYLRGDHASYADGIDWRFWRGYHYSLPRFEIKLRPTGFQPPSS